jgi:ankyrin repeat protein
VTFLVNWKMLEQLILKNDYEQLQKEIEINPEIVFLSEEHGFTLLMTASEYAFCDCVEVLVHAGSDINKAGRLENDTPLILAAYWGNFEVAKYLLEQGATVSLRDSDGASAFGYALRGDRNKDSNLWFDLFGLYKEDFDMEDKGLYKEYRLRSLFINLY